MRNVIVGCGGVGSWLAPKLCRLERELLLMDGDTLEEKNLDRQLFTASQIGEPKAKAVADYWGLANGESEHPSWRNEYFTAGLMRLTPDTLLWCCADNHAARREVLDACDLYGCRAIIGANEALESEAYFYKREWGGGPLDPRTFYPVILTDRSGDPLSPAGCVEAARSGGQVQTVLANGLAADLMLHLYWAWFREKIAEEFCPVWHKANVYKLTTLRYCDVVSASELNEPLLS